MRLLNQVGRRIDAEYRAHIRPPSQLACDGARAAAKVDEGEVGRLRQRLEESGAEDLFAESGLLGGARLEDGCEAVGGAWWLLVDVEVGVGGGVHERDGLARES